METTGKIDYAELVASALMERPAWTHHVEEMLAYEDEHPAAENIDGWQWHTVHTSPRTINQMVAEGVVNIVYDSRRYSYYKLVDREATREALRMVQMTPVEPMALPRKFDTSRLFQYVVGHDNAKTLLRYSLESDDSIHCLLIGPVGTAKSMMLDDMAETLPGAEMYVGSTTTKAGLVNLLIEKKPRYLIIDEIDKMRGEDMMPLLNLMEGGMVARLQAKSQERYKIRCSVFAGANNPKKMPDTVLSRFVRIQVPGYGADEFVDVSKTVLMQRLGIGPEQALHIASEVVKVSTDVRDAMKVGRLTKGHPLRVFEVIRALWPDQAKGVVRPFQARAR